MSRITSFAPKHFIQGNVLVDDKGRAVLADFGIASAVPTLDQLNSTDVTRTAGTPQYRPPELSPHSSREFPCQESSNIASQQSRQGASKTSPNGGPQKPSTPTQSHRKQPTVESDIYALGITMLEVR